MVDQEQWLRKRIAAGKPIRRPPWGSRLVITGSQLRSALLDDAVTSAGIVIRGGGVIIEGDSPSDKSIDLSYLAGRDGSALPPLDLRDCELRGTLRLTGSHFAFLSLDGCKFSRIDADHCQIDNHCRLINLGPLDPADPQAVAQIRMVAARIDGTADMRNSKLRAPSAKVEERPRSRADRYALSLASAEIAGRLLLDENFEALGGVSLYQATIRNSISVRTAKLESRLLGTPALDAQELRLAGTFLWANPQSGPADWHVAGEVVLRHAEIGGDCSFENCRWAGAGAGSLVEGSPVDHISGGIDLRFARVAGQLAICAGCRVAQGVGPPPRRTEEDWLGGIFGASVDAWKAHFGKGLRIECDAHFAGPVLLNGADIGHELIFRGDVAIPIPPVAVPSVPEALDLSNANIRGLVRIWGAFSGSVRMHGARIDGTVELQDLKFDCPPLTPGDPKQDIKRGLATVFDLSAARISGALHIGEISLVSACEKTPGETIREKVIGGRVLATRPHPTGDRRLLEFFLEGGICVTVFDGKDGPALFEGTHDQFLELSGFPLPLATPEDARGFLALYFATATGDLGPSRSAEIGTPEPDGKGWIVRGCEYLYAGCWYRNDVCINPKGKVWFERDRPIPRSDGRSDRLPQRIGPFTRASPDSPPVAEEPVERVWLDRLAAAVKAYYASGEERPLIVDLRGVDCRSFNDMQGMAWQWLGPQRHWRLLLDGISFVQFEDIDPKARSRRRPDDFDEPKRPVTPVSAPEPPRAARMRRIKTLLAYVETDRIRGWKDLRPAAASPSYSPHPFQTFARAYTQSGNHFLAVEIVKVQRRLQWLHAAVDIRESIARRGSRILGHAAIHGILLGGAAAAAAAAQGAGPGACLAVGAAVGIALWAFFSTLATGWPNILIGIGRLFDFTFGFGLKPRRALITMGLCLVAGIIAVNATDDLKPVPLSGASSDIAATRLQTAVEGCNTANDSVIDRAIYALDVFIPLIEFRQECAFVIDERAWFLRLLKTIYAALGWVVVSLTLLTFSGILRRDIQA